MKHLKSKLLVSTAMLVLCAVMLSSVSYAWFTLSTNPEIKGMKATVVANQNLEIALDNGYANAAAVDAASVYSGSAQGSTTGNPYTWGNLVDLGVAFTTLVPKMQPVQFVQSQDKKSITLNVPTYGPDGRVSALTALQGKIFSDYASVATPAGGVKGYSVNGTSDPYYAFSVDFWVKTNVAGDLALQTNKGVDRAEDADDTTNNVNNTEGAGSYIKVPGYTTAVDEFFLKLKVAFVTEAGDVVQATIAKNTNETEGNFTITCADIVTLAANTAQKVTMYVYFDGDTITNADALLADISNVEFNIQFKNTAINGSQAATGNDANTVTP